VKPYPTSYKELMSSEGPSEKKLKMAERIVVDCPLAPPAIGPYSQVHLCTSICMYMNTFLYV
jgi:hypothetical protein